MPAEPFTVLTPEGDLAAPSPVDVDGVRRLYGAMVRARAFDRKASAMQRQGRLATYAPFEGQEAAQIGAVAELEAQDWLVASYRDAAAMEFHGYPFANLILGRAGDERGGHAPEGVNVLPPSITVGGHMIHAVGVAWAQQLRDTDAVALTMFGDGATSEGDFHEAANFAGVYSLPVIFFCQNNGWAISMPRERQTASVTIAAKAPAYGIAGEYVDGNDVLAVLTVMRRALERARSGEGATLVEAVTYRVGPHTTADDPGRYREATDTDDWAARDPLLRIRRFLEREGAWDPDWQEEIEHAASGEVEEAVAAAEELAPFTTAEVFAAMFADPTPQLREQERLLEERG
jgi:pyruvate dehydrogenase E1 component alpha subunit